MSSCQYCGAALATDTRFCHSCGSPTEIKVGVSTTAVEGSADVAVMSPPAETGSKTMDTNVVGALTYLAGFLTGIIFLVLDPYKSNSFVRFHAFQSIFFNVAWIDLLDYLDDSLGGANTFNGRNLWLNCSAADVGFRYFRLWNLDFPDGSGLSAKTFQAADRW